MYCQSQITSGSIHYNRIYAVTDKIKSDNQAVQTIIEKMATESARISYTLNFNRDEAYFFANPIMLGNNLDKIFTGLVSFDHGKYKLYENKTDSISRELQDNRRTGLIIINRKTLAHWNLSSDTKTINGYKCFKAVTPFYSDDIENSTNAINNITAWYAPAIPIPFGPSGYGNLPGLILELQFLECTFGASKIDLNPVEPVFIDKLLQMKAVSEKEYENILLGNRSPEFERMIKSVK